MSYSICLVRIFFFQTASFRKAVNKKERDETAGKKEEEKDKLIADLKQCIKAIKVAGNSPLHACSIDLQIALEKLLLHDQRKVN